MNHGSFLVFLGILSVALSADDVDTSGIIELPKENSGFSEAFIPSETAVDDGSGDSGNSSDQQASRKTILVEELSLDTVMDNPSVVPDTGRESESIRQLRQSMQRNGVDTLSLSDGTVLIGKLLETGADGLLFLDNQTGREKVLALDRIRSITLGEGRPTITRKNSTASQQSEGLTESPEIIEVSEEKSKPAGSENTPGITKGPGRVVPRRQFALELRTNYFHYDEKFPEEDIRAAYGHNVRGTPKSTEYGLCLGTGFQGKITGNHVPLQMRFGFNLDLGAMHTYDGAILSKVSYDSYGRVVDAEILPYTFEKNNYFIAALVGFGWCEQFGDALAVTLWSGYNARLWVRDLLDPEDEDLERLAEYYYWLYLPIGLELFLATQGTFTIGISTVLDIMLGGRMKVFHEIDSPGIELEYPPVKLGRRLGLRISPEFIFRPSGAFSISISPQVNFSGFGKSNTEDVVLHFQGESIKFAEFYEPASRTVWGGLGVSVVLTP